MEIPRRGLLAGLGALLAAPALIRTPGLLMPVRPLLETEDAPGDEIISQLADAWARELLDSIPRAIAEMQRRRLAHLRFLEGAQWDDSTTLRIG